MEVFIEVVGWIAALLIVLAYGLLSTGRVDGRSITYQVMNIVGAGFIVNSDWNGAIPSTALNVVWLAIGFYALYRRRETGQTSSGSTSASG